MWIKTKRTESETETETLVMSYLMLMRKLRRAWLIRLSLIRYPTAVTILEMIRMYLLASRDLMQIEKILHTSATFTTSILWLQRWVAVDLILRHSRVHTIISNHPTKHLNITWGMLIPISNRGKLTLLRCQHLNPMSTWTDKDSHSINQVIEVLVVTMEIPSDKLLKFNTKIASTSTRTSLESKVILSIKEGTSKWCEQKLNWIIWYYKFEYSCIC